MPKYVRTLYWTSTEACLIIERVEEGLKNKPERNSIREDLCWLNDTVKKNPRIEWVAVLKKKPEGGFQRVINSKNFDAYVVRRWEKMQSPERKVWMMYIIPRWENSSAIKFYIWMHCYFYNKIIIYSPYFFQNV